MVNPLQQLLQAYRSGDGVPYAAYGDDMRDGISLMNRAMFLNLLGTHWLPAIPDVHARLQHDPPARVADVACGTGWSSIAIARAYPKARVDGIDLDSASIDTAQANAAATGQQPSAATGTMMRPGTLRAYALAAGFSNIEILPIDHDFWRFYRLQP